MPCTKPGPLCEGCPLEDRPMIEPEIRPGSLALIVGEAPGADEAVAGKPFIGASGRILRAVLREVYGVGSDEDAPVSITNTVLCHPPGNVDPPVDAVRRCAPLLQETLDGLGPSVVVAVGRVALSRFVGPGLINKIIKSRAVWDGYVYRPVHEIPRKVLLGQVEVLGEARYKSGPRKGQRKLVKMPAYADNTGVQVPVVGVLHPAGIMRGGFREIVRMQTALAVAKDVSEGAEVYTGPDSLYRAGYRPQQECGAVAFDIENPDRVNIAQIGFATDRGHVGSIGWGPSALAVTKEILEPTEGPLLVAHNAQYDVAHLEAAGVHVAENRLVDTMLAAQLLQPDLPKGLGSVAPRYLTLCPWKHFDEVDMAKYNAMDADVTVQLWKVMERLLESQGQLQFFREAVMPGSMTLRRMTKRGLKIGTAALQQWRADLEQQLEGMEQEWAEETEKLCGEPVNPGSTAQLKKLLYETLSMPVVDTTPSGAPSTAKSALAKLERKTKHPLLKKLSALRDAHKNLHTYAKDQGVGEDGCVHPQYLPEGKDEGDFGTASLRLAARNPNIQNQPVVARYQYVPHHHGWVIGETDFSQIEGRLVAVLSGEDGLMEAYAVGADIHQRNAHLWGVPRKTAKGILYAMQYGSGAGTLSKQFEVPMSVARGWLKAYADAHPKVWAWQRDVVRQAATYGFLENPFGIRRYFPGLSRDDAHVRNQALNFLPQSIVAGITWYLLAPLEQALEDLGGHLLTQVHDSFVWEAPADVAEEAARTVEQIMERPWDMVAPGWSCPTDSSIGESWGHAGQYDKEAEGNETGLDVWVRRGRPAHEEDRPHSVADAPPAL